MILNYPKYVNKTFSDYFTGKFPIGVKNRTRESLITGLDSYTTVENDNFSGESA